MKIKEQNFTQAGAILLVSAIIVKLISALFKIPLSADYALGDLGFGYFAAVYDLYNPIYTLALSGFPVAIARMVADFTAQKDEIGTQRIFRLSFKVLLILGVVGSFLFFAVALFFFLSKSENGLMYSFVTIAPAVGLCCLASVYRGYFEGKKNMIPTAVSNIIEALGKLMLGLTGAILTMRITNDPALASAAALLGIAVGTFLATIYLKTSYKKNGNTTSHFIGNRADENRLFKEFIALLIPVAIASLSVGITAFIDSLTLRGQLYGIIEQNGGDVLLKDTLYKNIADSEIPTLLYGVKGKAHTLFNLVPTLTAAFGISAVPIITECFSKGDRDSLSKNTDFCLKFSSCLSFPAAAGFIALGQPIMELLYGEKSAVLGGKLLAVYGIAVLFGGLSVPTTSLLQAVGRQKSALINIIIGIIFKVICSVSLTAVPSINIYGAAISTAGCFIIVFILNMACIIKKLGIVLNFKLCFISPLISSFFCGITALSVNGFFSGKIGTVLAIFFAAAVYICLLLFLKVLTKNDIRDLVKIQ